MTDKAYIVANKQQELDVLNKFEKKGFIWLEGEKPTEWVPSKNAFVPYNLNFPYVLASGDDAKIIWFMVDEITDEEIVYDGRKEEKMYKKYLVTQEFMNELIEWRNDKNLDAKKEFIDTFIDGHNIQNITDIISDWWIEPANPIENNNRLITIIQWLNGEDVFEVEEPHKFVVRSDNKDDEGDYWYVVIYQDLITKFHHSVNVATKFDTREEAQEWANSHQVVVEIDAEGNEVE